MIAMRVPVLHALPLLACLLTGCSALILEEVGEIGVPRDCAEPTKIFNTFAVRATSISWHGSKSDAAATLTVELVFSNEKKWPIALSNSGNGVLYGVEFSLHGDKGAGYQPKEITGVAISREPKKLKEAPSLPLFSRQQAVKKKPTADADKVLDVNFRIRPNEPQPGKLVFEVPRDNYLLTIERKFAGKPVEGTPTDHLSVCKISGENPALKPTLLRGVSGVY